jgi:hypothetical protein
MSPIVTHALIEPIEQIEYYSYVANGALTYNLRI